MFAGNDNYARACNKEPTRFLFTNLHACYVNTGRKKETLVFAACPEISPLIEITSVTELKSSISGAIDWIITRKVRLEI